MENKLPESQLVEILRQKASERSDVVFDYIAKLEELRLRIGGEVRFINELFPEYTPHDEEYHLSRLFHVADTLIEAGRYESMNPTELFVLACGLYGHDWGMAVSRDERDFIISGKPPDGVSPEDFALLHDEHKSFERFVKERGLEIDDIRANGIATEDWREYVRKTHAYRSGTRIRLYFQNIDSGISEAAGRVCEGHWLDIEHLQDLRRYPTNFPVLRENLNLAALAVYVRLVDLFDIGDDRTPYVIWKFVAPRDRHSRLEWNKHRALQPITCTTYLNGRVVLVHGSTDDHEVYAALEDLRGYCEKQLRECMDLLAQQGDPRHLMDLYHVEWQVAARGFDPVLIRFEFDRDRVFEILSSEIYQGDPYVFLRELLQNSIDAIRMRRELLERAGLGVDDFGLIEVKVEHGSNGDAKISWTDNGVGMDAYVVRNYLAVAGRSYYRSEEFERQGLKLDPISRFGVGILSCFMVANLVEIETYKEPYASAAGGALRIKIPSITRQFRIERSAAPDFGIGTRVTVHVEGRLLGEGTKSLDVTRYLRRIAGFVEFPIAITENSRTMVILHPKSTMDPANDRRFKSYPNVETHRIAFDYPLSEAILPQDLETARDELVERTFDLADDLGLSTCEGRITYLELRDRNKQMGRDYDFGGITLFENDQGDCRLIRPTREWNRYSAPKTEGISRSANAPTSYAVYRDGVLIPNATLPSFFTDRRESNLPLPQITVNLVKTVSAQLDLARIELRSDEQHWFEAIDSSLSNKLIQEFATQINEIPEHETLSRAGFFVTTYNLDTDLLLASARSQIPSGILSRKGTFETQKCQGWEGKAVPLCPEILENELWTFIQATVWRKPYKGYLQRWRGQDSVIASLGYYPDFHIAYAIDLTRKILARSHVLGRAILLRSPGNKYPPLVQEIWEPKDRETRELEVIAKQAIVSPETISASERAMVFEKGVMSSGLRFVAIPHNSKSPFRVGSYLFNLTHPVSQLLFRAVAWEILNRTISSEKINRGKMIDALSRFMPYYPSSESRMPKLNAAVKNLLAIASQVGLPTGTPVSLRIRAQDLWHQSAEHFARLAQEDSTTFGEPLNPNS